MKKLFIPLFILIGFSFQLRAQEGITNEDVPRKVKDAFITYFPAATDVSWSEGDDDLYEAEFYSEGVKHEMFIHEKGQVRMVRTELSHEGLPSKVKKLLKQDFPGFDVLKAARVVNQDVPSYEIRVQKSDETYDAIYNSNGQITKKSEVDN
jgi:hypothetical protein